jgi:hypothetical protein
MAEKAQEPRQKVDEQQPKEKRRSERKPDDETPEAVKEDVEVEDRFQSTDN